MPWKSIQQARWGHSPAGVKALGRKAAVSEWDAATPKGSLPKVAKAHIDRGHKQVVNRSSHTTKLRHG